MPGADELTLNARICLVKFQNLAGRVLILRCSFRKYGGQRYANRRFNRMGSFGSR
jgi:hypothetical protein